MVVVDAWRVCIKVDERRIWSSRVDFKVLVVSIVSNKCSKGCINCCLSKAACE